MRCARMDRSVRLFRSTPARGTHMNTQWMKAALVAAACIGGSAMAAEGSATLNLLTETGNGKAVGTVTITETRYGLVFTPALNGLPPGFHGFHVHDKGSCAPGQQ